MDNTRPTDRDIQGVAWVMAVTTKAWALALPKYFLYFTMLLSGNKNMSELNSFQISTSVSMWWPDSHAIHIALSLLSSVQPNYDFTRQRFTLQVFFAVRR